MEHLVQPTLDFISAHSSWAVAVMFVTSFGELFAFVSLLFPGTSLLIAAICVSAAQNSRSSATLVRWPASEKLRLIRPLSRRLLAAWHPAPS